MTTNKSIRPQTQISWIRYMYFISPFCSIQVYPKLKNLYFGAQFEHMELMMNGCNVAERATGIVMLKICLGLDKEENETVRSENRS